MKRAHRYTEQPYSSRQLNGKLEYWIAVAARFEAKNETKANTQADATRTLDVDAGTKAEADVKEEA